MVISQVDLQVRALVALVTADFTLHSFVGVRIWTRFFVAGLEKEQPCPVIQIDAALHGCVGAPVTEADFARPVELSVVRHLVIEDRNEEGLT